MSSKKDAVVAMVINQSALDAHGDRIARRAEDAVKRGIAAAKGQPIAEAVETVALVDPGLGTAEADEFTRA